MQVTFLDVRDAVIAALQAAFPEVPVSGEETGQQTAPRYLVQLPAASAARELGRRCRRTHPVVVRYEPGTGSTAPHAELLTAAEQLMAALESITIAGGQAAGTAMSFTIASGVLEFDVTYSFLVYAQAAASPNMQLLEHTEGLAHE